MRDSLLEKAGKAEGLGSSPAATLTFPVLGFSLDSPRSFGEAKQHSECLVYRREGLQRDGLLLTLSENEKGVLRVPIALQLYP